MPVQRSPRCSAGPTASGLPLEPQITIPLLSEQEAQDPAVPANVPQPFVAEAPKTQRAESALQATASSPQHCTGSTCRPGLHSAAASSRLSMLSTARATSAHDLVFCNTDKTTVVAAKGLCCGGTTNLDDSPTTCVEKLRVPETAAPRPGNVGSLTEKPTISHEIYLITKPRLFSSRKPKAFPKHAPKSEPGKWPHC